MDMSQHPATSVSWINEADLALRVEIYEEGGAFASDLRTIWNRAGSLIETTMLAEAATLRTERAGTLAEQRIRQAIKEINQPRNGGEWITKSLVWMFVTPFGESWIREMSCSEMIKVEVLMPSPTMGDTTSRLFCACVRAIAQNFADDPAFVDMATRRFMKLLAIKLEIVADVANQSTRAEQRKLRATRGGVFRESVGVLLSEALQGSKDLRSRTAAASGSARGMLGKTSEVAAAAEQSAIAMREAAQTAAGLIRAIEDARNEVEVAAGVATRAGDEAHRAVEVSKALSEHAQAIESILGLIRDIAGQTNLLALNATIEAARAGDAGRGFAVVAQEVKSLANQTARATDDIAAKIGAIQVATRETVNANGSIRTTIGDVQSSAERIRTAMEMQAQTVTMITAAVDETALAADAMSGTVAAIRTGTENLAGDIDTLDSGFRDVDGKIGALETRATEFIASLS